MDPLRAIGLVRLVVNAVRALDESLTELGAELLAARKALADKTTEVDVLRASFNGAEWATADRHAVESALADAHKEIETLKTRLAEAGEALPPMALIAECDRCGKPMPGTPFCPHCGMQYTAPVEPPAIASPATLEPTCVLGGAMFDSTVAPRRYPPMVADVKIVAPRPRPAETFPELEPPSEPTRPDSPAAISAEAPMRCALCGDVLTKHRLKKGAIDGRDPLNREGCIVCSCPGFVIPGG
jgi:hypothetical protein